MDINILKHTGRFLILIIIQVYILNHIYLGGYITPYIYPLFILMLPFDIRGWVLLTTAFVSGLAVDMFSDSLGMHAAASVFLAFMRPFVIRFISNRNEYETSNEPSVENNGWPWIIPYTLILLFFHHFALFAIEVFRLDDILRIILRTILSTAFSALIVFIAHLLMGRTAKTRA